MACLLHRLFGRKSFRPEFENEANIPPPKLIATAHLYDYIDFKPAVDVYSLQNLEREQVQNSRREYMYTLLKYKAVKEQLRRLEDGQFEAVLSGKVTAEDSFNFTDRYEQLREQAKLLDGQRRRLKRKVCLTRKATPPPQQRSAVYYAPI